MLTKCPECLLQVSTLASTCPHCGYPMKVEPKKPKISTKKRPRLPNGFGQISKLNNPNLRAPYRAMITVGKNEYGRPICKLLKPVSYFKTYNEAYEALVEYNRNPYEFDKLMTVEELYAKWSEQHFAKLENDSSRRGFEACWRYCTDIYKISAKDIRARHLKGVLENGIANINGELKPASAGTKSRIKSMFNLMFDYALEYEIVDKNYARTFSVDKDIIEEAEKQKNSHIAFTDYEMNTLWENINIPFVKWIIIQCYTGLRPQELCQIKNENINFDNWTMIGGMKTEAGTDRIIPIHKKIKVLVRTAYNASPYLMNEDGKQISYEKYKRNFDRVIESLKLDPRHRPHDCRKQFVTMAKKYNVDEYAIKRIVGHTINDITEAVYTERPIEWLHSEINKIM